MKKQWGEKIVKFLKVIFIFMHKNSSFLKEIISTLILLYFP